MADGSPTTMLDALTCEAAQILQDMSAVISRQAHLVEKLALLQRGNGDAVELWSGRESINEVRSALSERGIPLDQVVGLRDSLRSASTSADIDEPAGNSDNSASRANAAAEAEGTITAQPPEAEAVSRVAPGRTGDGAAESGAAPSEASDAGSQADEAAGGVTVGGDESGTAAPQESPAAPQPPAPKTKKEQVLDRYAETGDDNRALAKHTGSALGSVEIYLSQARKICDPRVARGDSNRIRRQEQPTRQALAAATRVQEGMRRLEEAPPPPPAQSAPVPGSAAYKAATQPKTVEPHEDDICKPLCRIDFVNRMVDGPDDEVPLRGSWLKVVAMMADQRRYTTEELMPMCGSTDRRAFNDALKRTNLALAKTGLTLHDCDGVGLFQLRKLL